MSTINTNYKADTVLTPDQSDATPTDQTGQTDSSSLADLKNRLDEAILEIENTKTNYGTSLTDEQLAEMNRLEVMMKAESVAIEAYGKGGTAPQGAALDSQFAWEKPTALPSGFSVAEGDSLRITPPPTDGSNPYPDIEGYAGTVNFKGSRLNFSLQDDAIQEVKMYSRGKDLVLTVIKSDGTKESWLIVDGAVRSEPILIDATTMTHSVKIDASHALRISDGKHGQPYGLMTGFQIWGTDYDDTIYGSQGIDGIAGLAGNNFIDGGAGDDTIYGGGVYDPAKEKAPQTVDGLPAGDNEVRGGAGNDHIYGGAGFNTGYTSDSTDLDQPHDMGGEMKDDVSNAPDPATTNWLGLDQWDWDTNTDGTTKVEEDGTVVIRHTGDSGGTIDIDMSQLPGYTMALADIDPEDSMALIITFVGEDANGNPQTFKLRIEDFFKPTTDMDPAAAVITLNIHGNDQGDILDFHKLMGPAALESQNINLYGGAGNDFILGAESAVTRDGIDLNDPLKSTVSNSEMDQYNTENIFYNNDETSDGYQDGYVSDVDTQNGQIVVTKNPDPAVTQKDTVRIVAPDHYDRGYITMDADGNTYVILVKQGGHGKADTIVIKFDKSTGLDYTKIFVKDGRPDDVSDDSKHTPVGPVPLIPIEFSTDMDLLSGGGGSDMMFGGKNSNFDSDDNDYVVKGSFADDTPKK
jgi:hypothetical protein